MPSMKQRLLAEIKKSLFFQSLFRWELKRIFPELSNGYYKLLLEKKRSGGSNVSLFSIYGRSKWKLSKRIFQILHTYTDRNPTKFLQVLVSGSNSNWSFYNYFQSRVGEWPSKFSRHWELWHASYPWCMWNWFRDM